MMLASSQSKSTLRERMALVTMAMFWGRTERPMRMGGELTHARLTDA